MESVNVKDLINIPFTTMSAWERETQAVQPKPVYEDAGVLVYHDELGFKVMNKRAFDKFCKYQNATTTP